MKLEYTIIAKTSAAVHNTASGNGSYIPSFSESEIQRASREIALDADDDEEVADIARRINRRLKPLNQPNI